MILEVVKRFEASWNTLVDVVSPHFWGDVMEFFQPMLQSFPGHLFHAAWLKVNRINRLTGRRVLKARWVENFILLNVISCPATTVQISQGFGARLPIKLFAYILPMLFGCFAMNMLIYKECCSRLSTLFSHFHFRCLAGERTLSLRRRVMLDCRLHSCFVFFFFGGGVIYFLAADRQITWRRASRTKDQAACSKERRLYVRMIFDLRCAELNWKQVAEVQKPVEEQNLLIFHVITTLPSMMPPCVATYAKWCYRAGPSKRIRHFNCTWDVYPILAVIYSLVIPDLSIFLLVI